MSFFKPQQMLSFSRMSGLVRKEFLLILRDKGTIAMLVIMPLMLLTLFGFAISLDPKMLPTAIISYDETPLTRLFINDLKSSNYFRIIDTTNNEALVKEKLVNGQLSFIINIPANFTRKFIRGENPELLVEIDGSDPGSNGTALAHIGPILDESVNYFTSRGLAPPPAPGINRTVNLISHRMYNPANLSSYDIVPGLIGVMLTLTMVMLTSTAITSEFEAGTMEILLSTPLLPTEIILGKVIPYILLGYIQLTVILLYSKLLIDLPMEGSLLFLYISAAPFILASLMVGMIFSALAKTPMQAMQLSIFYQLPSMFLSGYIFSFYGMPMWARFIGYCLPMTYFMRITRGILLKGESVWQIWPNIMPILLITLLLILVTKTVFRKTLD